jgi:hypothetical protein
MATTVVCALDHSGNSVLAPHCVKKREPERTGGLGDSVDGMDGRASETLPPGSPGYDLIVRRMSAAVVAVRP